MATTEIVATCRGDRQSSETRVLVPTAARVMSAAKAQPMRRTKCGGMR